MNASTFPTVVRLQARIEELLVKENERKAKEAAYNQLEGGIYKAKDQLADSDFIKVFPPSLSCYTSSHVLSSFILSTSLPSLPH